MLLFSFRYRPFLGFVFALTLLFGRMPIGYSQDDFQVVDVRRSATVTAIEKSQPAVAAVYAFDDGRRGTGSGSVIDPRGYVLTAKHVVMKDHIVLLGGRPPLRASLIGTMPEFDVAILKLGEQALHRPGAPTHPRANLPPDFIRLSVEADVRMGETVLNIGSPGGRGIVATQGILSAVAFTGVNPLALATQSSTAFDEMLQFDAASNPGNSGGPLVNLLGQQIGMAVSGIPGEEGVHFALPLKTIRHSIPAILNSELRHRYISGITIDPQLADVVVSEVAGESPASAAGIQPGDQIISVGGRGLRDPIDWEFTRFDWRPGDQCTLGIRRGDETMSASIKLSQRTGRPGQQVAATEPGLLCRQSPYDPRLPNPLDEGQRPEGPPTIMTVVGPKPDSLSQEDHYELLIEGLLKVDHAGVYRLGLRSDDGSKLYVHDELLIDNNGNHAPIVRTDWVDLQAGLHPIRIEFYEDEGDQVLELLMAKGDRELEAVSTDRLFHQPESNAAETASESE
ncbi:trypsin-like peptidase domain-containing protein [Rubripirellula reticaptiva]|uniref:Serine endoprotease DegS n=1 Tax=Rubripirellula reticaptiva TaxID=2528013 RepID=A0A5C6F2Q2_9BACT|nr:trypsin-like peptidase domain-containing protein [Rubripirellula reticaptiva]TWU56073.1 Serine endoprotease DegS [Rubripirellula reticaptiva]